MRVLRAAHYVFPRGNNGNIGNSQDFIGVKNTFIRYCEREQTGKQRERDGNRVLAAFIDRYDIVPDQDHIYL